MHMTTARGLGWVLAGFGVLAMGCSDDGIGTGAGGGDGGTGSSGSGGATATMSASGGMSATAATASASGADSTATADVDDGIDDTMGGLASSSSSSTDDGGAGSSSDDAGSSSSEGGDSSSEGSSSESGGSSEGSSSDGSSSEGGSSESSSSSEGGSSSESSTGDEPQVEGFGDCVNNLPATVCLPEEQCITDRRGHQRVHPRLRPGRHVPDGHVLRAGPRVRVAGGLAGGPAAEDATEAHHALGARLPVFTREEAPVLLLRDHVAHERAREIARIGAVAHVGAAEQRTGRRGGIDRSVHDAHPSVACLPACHEAFGVVAVVGPGGAHPALGVGITEADPADALLAR
jgi:hypothetical protein